MAIADDLDRDRTAVLEMDGRTVRVLWSGRVPGLCGVTTLHTDSVANAHRVARMITGSADCQSAAGSACPVCYPLEAVQ